MGAELLQVKHRLYWLHVLSFLGLAGVVYARARRGSERRGLRGFLRFVFPARLWTHPSARTDYKLFVANSIVSPVTTLFAWASATLLGIRLALFLDAHVMASPQLAWSGPVTVAFSLALTAAIDLAQFLNHYLHHRVPFLWPFHAVHHSAEVLTPITAYRKHPFYDVTKKFINAAVVGVFMAAVIWAFGGQMRLWNILGTNAFYVAFLFFGVNLRHSHLWLDWGPVVDRVLISPAQHQIHHSVEPRHLNKNFGSIFAIWDWMAGTLYVPRGREEFRIGLGADAPQEHPTLRAAWLRPLLHFARALRVRGGEPLRTGQWSTNRALSAPQPEA